MPRAEELVEGFGRPDESLFVVPLAKSIPEADRRNRVICGLATVEDRDIQGETVLVKGIDTSYLDMGAKLNWEHSGETPADWIGKVLDHKIGRVRDIVPRSYWHLLKSSALDKMGVWIRAQLYKGVKTADEAWATLSNNEDAGWGFSVQGFTVRRDPANKSTILQSICRHIALTPQPVNPLTFAALAKSLAVSYQRTDQTDGQAMVPQSLGGSIKDLTGAKRSLAKFLAQVENGEKTVLDATEDYFKATGVDSETAKALVTFVRANAGRVVAKSLGGPAMDKCQKCGHDVAKGTTLCPVCTAKVDPVEELNKSLGGDAPPPGDDETPPPPAPSAEHEAGETKEEETEEEKAKREAEEAKAKEKGGEGAPPPEPTEKSLAGEAAPEGDAALDVTELVKSLAENAQYNRQGTEVLAKALIASQRREEAMAKSLATLSGDVLALNGKIDGMMEKFGVLAKTPQPRGGKPVEVLGKSIDGKRATPGASADAADAHKQIAGFIARGQANENEIYAYSTGRIEPEALLKSLKERYPDQK